MRRYAKEESLARRRRRVLYDPVSLAIYANKMEKRNAIPERFRLGGAKPPLPDGASVTLSNVPQTPRRENSRAKDYSTAAS